MRSWQPQHSQSKKTLSLTASYPRTGPYRSIGEILYEANCQNCHGDLGQGDLGPSLSAPEFLTLANDKYLYDAITSGRPGAGMPAWRHFSDTDAAILIKHLRSWQTGRKRVLPEMIHRGDRVIGKFLFGQMCVGCHGSYGEGSIGIQLTNTEFLRSASDEMLHEWISEGKTGTPMLGFGPLGQGIANLRDDQITDIITYIRYLDDNPVFALRINPFGNSALGREGYAAMCSSCHGEHGEGSSGPSLSNRSFLQAASDGFLMATLAMGRDGTEMRPVTKNPMSIHSLPTNDVNDIIAFVRSFTSNYPTTEIINPISAPADAHAGRTLYDSNCSGCHGINGKPNKALTRGTNTGQVVAPTLNNREFLWAATDGFIRATIIRGRRGTAMRPFGTGFSGLTDLTTEDIYNIVAYIRTWSVQHASAGITTDKTGNVSNKTLKKY